MERDSASIHGLGSARAGCECSRLIGGHWGGEVRVTPTLATRQTAAEERLLWKTHLAQATGRWCLYTHRNGRCNSHNRPVTYNYPLTPYNLPAFIFQVYFTLWDAALKFPTLFPWNLKAISLVSVSQPKRTFWRINYWTRVSPQLYKNAYRGSWARFISVGVFCRCFYNFYFLECNTAYFHCRKCGKYG